MLRHRCPWCGAVLPFALFNRSEHPYSLSHALPECPICKKEHEFYQKKNEGNGSKRTKLSLWLFVLLALVIVLPLCSLRFRHDIPWWVTLAGLPFAILIFIYGLSFPYMRKTKHAHARENIEKPKQPVCITWNLRQNQGLLFPRIQVPNGEIFPACFIDANGTPLNAPLCVVLENINWINSRSCLCDVSLVLDDAPAKALFDAGEQFCLYYNQQEVAKGILQQNTSPT